MRYVKSSDILILYRFVYSIYILSNGSGQGSIDTAARRAYGISMADIDKTARFKAQVKAWLKVNGIDYLWLAEQCGVSENTVRNWMAKAPIPPRKQQLIMKLINQLPADPIAAPGAVVVSPDVTLSVKMAADTYAQLVQAAQQGGKSVADLINESITELAARGNAQGGPLARSRKIVLPVNKKQ